MKKNELIGASRLATLFGCRESMIAQLAARGKLPPPVTGDGEPPRWAKRDIEIWLRTNRGFRAVLC